MLGEHRGEGCASAFAFEEKRNGHRASLRINVFAKNQTEYGVNVEMTLTYRHLSLNAFGMNSNWSGLRTIRTL